eukprot:TRINITY_DN3239_c0_g1_i1.p1 TRINITY_DN3239_c0_g1~~TRINITY_DN3239_c0_g1_i1.p1  ORF type:complete len:217 (-),score=88.19 TRINITY_DN3239_c0_g1_i1:164-814(-)
MPKKFGTNTKADEARARKDMVRKEETARKQKEKEDKAWEETDEKVIAKQKKKEEEEAKKKEMLAKKAEKKALEEKEAQEISKAYAKPQDKKLTRAMINEQQEAERARAEAERRRKEKKDEEPELEPNINHMLREQRAQNGADAIDARDISEAVAQLDIDKELDKHPEKRLKAAFKEYETTWLPVLKKENPGLKLSQVRELLWRQWLKAPENPLNQQ